MLTIFTSNRTQSLGYKPDDFRQNFTGYERDNETDLDFAQARYYKKQVGRFTSVDPTLASIKPTNPQTLNRYTYGLNNPLRYVDPDGQIPLETFIDVVSLADSFYSLIRNPSWVNAGFLVWDLVALTPYVPGSWVAKGAHKLSRESVEWNAKVVNQGYRGLKVGKSSVDVKNALEVATNNEYLRKGIALLSQGDQATRRLLGNFTGKAADFVGVTKSGTFIVGDSKGITKISQGIEQLDNTVNALYRKVVQGGSGGNFKVAAELIFESASEINRLPIEYGINGSQLVKFVDGKQVPVMIDVMNNGRRVQRVPVQVRFLQ